MKEFYLKNQQKKNHFQTGLLEYPQYTRPEVFEGVKVPEVLLSGNHKNIAKWRNEQSIQITRKKRPDLLKNELGKQFLLPYIDEVIKKIDLENEKITVHIIDGLI